MNSSLRPDLALLTLDFSPQPGGVQEYLFEIAQRLGGEGTGREQFQVIVLTPAGGSLPGGTHFRRIVVPTSAPWHFLKHLLSLRPRRVLVGHAHPRLLLAASMVAWGRYGVIVHGNDFLAAQWRWHRPFFNRLLAQASPLICNSFATADRLEHLGLSATSVIHPGTDPQRFVPSPSPTPAPPVLLTVCRLVPGKGIVTVLRTLPDLLAEFPDLRYRVAGSGPDRPRLEALAGELGVAHVVEFLGGFPNQALPDVYRSAHIFVMPAHESFGIVYLEASASGLPVVAGRSGGTAEAVREGETGLLVAPDDPQELAATLSRLLREPELRHRLGQAGRRWVETEMNWERAARQVQQALATR